MHVKVRVRTAALPAHSGNYSLLPNAAWRLSSLLASMRGADGQVTIAGFEDDVDPPTQDEHRSLEEASRAEPAIAGALGAARFEGDSRTPYYERLLFHPALIVNQLESGRPGNQIPVVAEALLEVRLVTHQDPEKVYAAIARHVRERLPDAEVEFQGGSRAARMRGDDPMVRWGIESASRAAGGPVIVYPSLGGTLPLLATIASEGHRYLGLPLVNFDNNQHVGNENLKVEALARGIEFLDKFYDALAGD
jgi:acetylornithine deacetylase/succinyl-diaminopimelate desuccinylase-like protein